MSNVYALHNCMYTYMYHNIVIEECIDYEHDSYMAYKWNENNIRYYK